MFTHRHLDQKLSMPASLLRLSDGLCSVAWLHRFCRLSLKLLAQTRGWNGPVCFCWHTAMSCRSRAVQALQLKSWRNKQRPSSTPTSPLPLTAARPPTLMFFGFFLLCPSGFLMFNVGATESSATLQFGGNVHKNTLTHTRAHTHTSLGEQIKALWRSFAQNDRWQCSLRGEACKYVPVVPRLSEEGKWGPSNRCSRGQAAQMGTRTRNAF